MIEYFIYCIIDPRTNTVFYVGKTKDMNQRITNHLYSNPTCLQIKEAGFKCVFNVIFRCSEKYSGIYEKIFIDYYDKIGYHLDNAICVNRRIKKNTIYELNYIK